MFFSEIFLDLTADSDKNHSSRTKIPTLSLSKNRAQRIFFRFSKKQYPHIRFPKTNKKLAPRITETASFLSDKLPLNSIFLHTQSGILFANSGNFIWQHLLCRKQHLFIYKKLYWKYPKKKYIKPKASKYKTIKML